MSFCLSRIQLFTDFRLVPRPLLKKASNLKLATAIPCIYRRITHYDSLIQFLCSANNQRVRRRLGFAMNSAQSN